MKMHDACTDTNKVVCVYPPSAPYSPLQRYNHYAVIVVIFIFVKFYPNRRWLIAGATASMMIFASVTAIHAIALACSTMKNRAAFDMDIVGSMIVLVITTIFLLPVLNVSKALRNKKARKLIRLWGLFLVIGIVCGYVSIMRKFDSSYPCVDLSTNQTLRSPSPPGLERYFNCTPACFKSRQIFRDPSQLKVVDMNRIFGEAWYRLFVTFLVLGIFACLYGLYSTYSDVDLGNWADRGKLSRRKDAEPRGIAMIGQYIIWGFVVTSPFQALVIIIFAEVYLLHGPGLPQGEAPYSISQWSCWVATALVALAAPAESGKENDQKSTDPEMLSIYGSNPIAHF